MGEWFSKKKRVLNFIATNLIELNLLNYHNFRVEEDRISEREPTDAGRRRLKAMADSWLKKGVQ